jgi:hypothetical protein
MSMMMEASSSQQRTANVNSTEDQMEVCDTLSICLIACTCKDMKMILQTCHLTWCGVAANYYSCHVYLFICFIFVIENNFETLCFLPSFSLDVQVVVNYQTLDSLLEHGIAANDIQKLNDAGYHTVESVRYNNQINDIKLIVTLFLNLIYQFSTDCTCHG